MGVKYSIAHMQKSAEQRGGKCLSERYINSMTKLKWQCKEGHVWEAIPTTIVNGTTWCPRCKRIRLTLNDMNKFAASKGGKCISPKYEGYKHKLTWQCEKGHIWDAFPNDVLSKGSWCPHCRKLSLEMFQEIAASKGGECLSTTYKNSTSKLTFRCEKGHTWDTAPATIKVGHWCPVCAKLEVGKQNVQNIVSFNGGTWNPNEYKNTRTRLSVTCETGHTWKTTPDNLNHGSWCPTCKKLSKKPRREYTLRHMQEIAEKHEGKCLSSEYRNSATKLTWECKQGHTWDAIPNNVINNGSWCPICAREPRNQQRS